MSNQKIPLLKSGTCANCPAAIDEKYKLCYKCNLAKKEQPKPKFKPKPKVKVVKAGYNKLV